MLSGEKRRRREHYEEEEEGVSLERALRQRHQHNLEHISSDALVLLDATNKRRAGNTEQVKYYIINAKHKK